MKKKIGTYFGGSIFAQKKTNIPAMKMTKPLPFDIFSIVS